MLSPFLPAEVHARNGPVTDSVNVSQQDEGVSNLVFYAQSTITVISGRERGGNTETEVTTKVWRTRPNIS